VARQPSRTASNAISTSRFTSLSTSAANLASKGFRGAAD
jgi:hypothetical protein